MFDIATVRAVGPRRYLRALIHSGWAWLLAGLLILGNTITATVGAVRSDDSLSYLIVTASLLVAVGWLLVRAHALALRELRSAGVLPPSR